MKIRRLPAVGLLLAALVGTTSFVTMADTTQAQHRVVKHRHTRRKKLIKKGGWAGAGFAAGEAAGPAGSAAVGAAKYRKDLKAGGTRRTKAVAKIAAPIAAGAVAGPAGSAGVEVVEHRNWIKRHIFHRKPHKPPRKTPHRNV
ncbi:MAG TPA: hypothetical protein VGK48_11300 [Terriglobia bacterium]|jgi:hypothetical protein